MTLKRLGLAGKVLIGVTGLFVLVAVTTSIVGAWNLNRVLTREFETKGAAIANSIANSSVEVLLTRRGSSLQAMVDEFLQIPGVGYVFVVDGDRQIVSHTFVPTIPAWFTDQLDVLPMAAATRQGTRVEEVSIPDMGEYIDVTAPILAGVAGVVHVGMDRSVIQAQVRSAALLPILSMLVIFSISLALAFIHVTRVTRPMGVLTAHARHVDERLRAAELTPGHADVSPDVDPALASLAAGASDEVGDLAMAFQQMELELRRYIGNLRRANLEVEEYNRTLEQKVGERTRELQDKNGELESAMVKLKQAQEQIITHEKLASLGALTAGVAHEIKNPLNFINNFAQLSAELTGELREAVEKAVPAEASADILDVTEMLQLNVQKINEHGKRADSIVRNMLMHSRARQGERTAVDINAMLNEYVGLAYHGMRGQDQTFNAKIETSFDPAVGMVAAIPQDLSRAFLNLLTNACYAIHEKKKQRGDDFAPVLSVRTKAVGDSVEIRIRDNGNGIPAAVREKMFEPFFTTKPAGSGTGLGLSMTFDIIVQAHKGAIDVETEPGSFAEIIITLPGRTESAPAPTA